MTEPSERRPGWAGGDVLLLVVAIVLAVAVLVVSGITAVVAVVNSRAADARIGATFELADLREGDCVAERPVYVPTEFTVVDCSTPHAAEFVFFVDQAAAVKDNLGDRALNELASTYCETTLRYRINLSDAVDELPDAEIDAYVGSRSLFAGGFRFQCFLYNSTGRPLEQGYYVDDGL